MADAAELIASLNARRADLRSLGYRVRFDLTDLEEALLLDGTAEGGGETTSTAADAEADSVLRLSSADLAKLIAGRLSPMLAFSTGKLRVEGSRGVALKLAGMLDEG